MYCIKCGNKLDDSAQFCSKCGTPVTTVSETAKVTDAAPVSVPAAAEAAAPAAEAAVPAGQSGPWAYKKLKKNTLKNLIGCWIFFIISLFLIAAVIVFGVFMYKVSHPKDLDTLTESDMGILPTYATGSIYRVLGEYQGQYLIMLPSTDCFNFSIYDDPMQLTGGIDALRSGNAAKDRRIVFLEKKSCSPELQESLDKMVKQQNGEGDFWDLLGRFVMPERTEPYVFSFTRTEKDALFYEMADLGQGGSGYDASGLRTSRSEKAVTSEAGFNEMVELTHTNDFLNGDLTDMNYALYQVRMASSSQEVAPPSEDILAFPLVAAISILMFILTLIGIGHFKKKLKVVSGYTEEQAIAVLRPKTLKKSHAIVIIVLFTLFVVFVIYYNYR